MRLGQPIFFAASVFATAIAVELALTPAVKAAETVVLRYGIFRGSVPVQDLTDFAETGETSGRLRRYLRLSKQEPEDLRQFLTKEVKTEPKTLDRLLNSPAGEVILNQFSDYVYTTSTRDDEGAIRTALTRSAEDDSQLSFIEVLQDYPAEEVHINVRRVISTYNRFASIQERISGVLEGGLDEVLQEIDLF